MRVAIAIAFLVAGCTSASDFAGFHAGPAGDLASAPDLAIPSDDLGIVDGSMISGDGKPAIADAQLAPDLMCGAAGAPCCMGTTCTNSCCSNGTCVAVGAACAVADTACRGGMVPACAECGRPGQACCPQSLCIAGGCCTQGACVASGSDVNGMVCADGAIVACGTPGGACCANNICSGDGCCYGDQCIAPGAPCLQNAGTCNALAGNGNCGTCGGLDQSCCPGGPGGGNNADFCTGVGLNSPVIGCDVRSDQCVNCGGINQPCCDGNRCVSGCCDHGQVNSHGTLGACLADGNQCTNNAVCKAGSCGVCGGVNQPACGVEPGCTAPLTVASNNNCIRCGGLGQACCTGANGGWCSPPFGCDGNSKCQLCGAAGEPCCPGGTCKPNHACVNGVLCV